AMDGDGAREVGRPRVIEPVVVGEPGVALRYRDQISRPLVVETELHLARVVEHPLHAVDRAQDAGHPVAILAALHVDVRDLVIGDGESARLDEDEKLPDEWRLERREEAGLAEDAVRMQGTAGVGGSGPRNQGRAR